MKIDLIIVTCGFCKDVREFKPAPITNALTLRFYMDDVVGACPKCGHQTADVKARDRDPTTEGAKS